MLQFIYIHTSILTLIRRGQSLLSTRGKSTLYEGKDHSLRGESLHSSRGKSTLYEGKVSSLRGESPLSTRGKLTFLRGESTYEGKVDLRWEGRLTKGR